MKIILLMIAVLLNPMVIWGQNHSRIDSLKGKLNSDIGDSLLVLTAIDLSRAVHDLDHHDEEDYFYAKKARDVAEDHHDSLLYAKALDNLGLLYRFHQNYAEAFPLHGKAYQLIEGKNVPPYYPMRFANNAGVAARYDQKYDEAVHYFLEALKVAEEKEDLKNLAISSNGLGNTLSFIPGREDEALRYFEQALKAEQKRNNSLGVAINFLSISDYYTGKNEFGTARGYLEKLLKINQDRKDLFGLGMTYEFYGYNYFKEGLDLQQAQTYSLKSLKLFSEIGNRNKQADVLKLLGDIFFRQGSLNQAKDHYQQSLEIAVALNQKQLMMDNTLGLSKLYERASDYVQALDYYKLSQAYKDSINLKEQEKQIAGMKLAYDFDKKESEIALLKKDKNIQEAEFEAQKENIKKQQAFVYFVLGGLLALLLLFFLIYRNLNIKKNAKLLVQEQEKKRLQTEYENNILQAEILASRMQMNPHFLFNCLNSIKYLIQSENYKKAIDYLTIFSRFIRTILETGKKKTIPLTEELDLIRHYVKLEENRFDQSFIFHIRYVHLEPDDLEDLYIPPLLLQPFAENAIWHGLLASKRQKKSLEISITRQDADIIIAIEDNGLGRKNPKVVPTVNLHKSMGTKIAQDRIDLFNKNSNRDISFQIVDLFNQANEPLGTRVVIKLRSMSKEKIHLENQLSE